MEGEWKILLLDDDDYIIRFFVPVVKAFLSQQFRLKFRFETIARASELRARLDRGERYDLLIVDLMLPQEESILGTSAYDPGIQFLRDICRGEWPGQTIDKVIVYTAVADREVLGVLSQEFHLPEERLLLKPLREEDLAQAITDTLGGNL